MTEKYKTIIHVWTQDFLELYKNKSTNYFGFGDLIRCSIELYKLCKCMNYNFILDISLHPISQFYNEHKHEYSEIIKNNKDKIYHIPSNDMLRYISKEIKKQNILYFISNFGSSISNPNFGETDIETNERTDYFKKIFTPNEEFMKYINENYRDILKNNFNILHYRLGDEYLIDNDNNNYDKIYKHLNKIYKKDDIFICDSVGFKTYIKKQNNNINIIDGDICHIGKNKDEKMLRNTLTELYIVSKSNNIKTFTVYGWSSGFVCHISKLYNIPLQSEINFNFCQ